MTLPATTRSRAAQVVVGILQTLQRSGCQGMTAPAMQSHLAGRHAPATVRGALRRLDLAGRVYGIPRAGRWRGRDVTLWGIRPMTDAPTYYTVIDIFTGEKVYRGTSLTMAAEKLTPGTVWGSGKDRAAAGHDAWAKLPDPHARRKHRLALEGV